MERAFALAYFQRHASLLLGGDLDGVLRFYAVPLTVHFETGDMAFDDYAQVHDLLARHLEHLRDNNVSALKPMVGEVERGAGDRLRVMVIWETVSPKGSLLIRADYFLKNAPQDPVIGMIDFAMPVPPRFLHLVQREEGQDGEVQIGDASAVRSTLRH